jgi:hypothetical protein
MFLGNKAGREYRVENEDKKRVCSILQQEPGDLSRQRKGKVEELSLKDRFFTTMITMF